MKHNQKRFPAIAMFLFATMGCINEKLSEPEGTVIVATLDETSEELPETRVSISEETLPNAGKIYYYWNPELLLVNRI